MQHRPKITGFVTNDQAKLVIEETVKKVLTPHLLPQLKYKNKPWQKILFRWSRTFKRLLPLGGASEGNKLQIYSNGDDAFQAMWNAIDNAKSKIWMETYILEPDTIGTRTIERLTNAVQRGIVYHKFPLNFKGCEVKLIYDYLGSQKLNETHLWDFKKAGGQPTAFNPIFTWPWNVKHWGIFRNHRKILVVDDEVAFTGGMNIGDQYSGTKTGGNGWYRDTHVKVEGPAVNDLAKVFLSSLEEAHPTPIYQRFMSMFDPDNPSITPITKKFELWKSFSRKKLVSNALSKIVTKPEEPDKITVRGCMDSGVFVQILQSNIRRQKQHIQKALNVSLKQAIRHCYITTPYFLPPNKLKESIISAANNLVDVRVLTAGLTDVPVSRFASQHVYHILLRKGVRIYEYNASALHAKTITIDGIYSAIGSFNLDPLSHFWNLETNLTTLDPETASELEEQFLKDIANSTEVTLADLKKRTIFQKILHWLCYQFMRLFG